MIDCPLFCQGPILHTVQMSGIFNGSKEFVDMPMRSSLEVIQTAFEALPNHADDTLRDFVSTHFAPVGSDVIKWNITDWVASPQFLATIPNTNLREFGSGINEIWKILGRQPSPGVYQDPMRHTLIPTKYPMIVPGGRFREVYYWDTYWVVRGLLICDMHETATHVTENLLDFVDRFGFVPNGNRRYYLDRSQPPFLVHMVDAVFKITNSQSFLSYALPLLDKEYEFWMGPSGHAIDVSSYIAGGASTPRILNRFFVQVAHPRPESYVEDEHTAQHLQTQEEKVMLWSNLATGAETGWDYSSRWFADRTNLRTITTRNIIPVDLNSVMCANELMLSKLHAITGNHARSQHYKQAAEARRSAMHDLLWDESSYQWKDYNMKTRLLGPVGISSNFLPLWGECHEQRVNTTRVAETLAASGLILPAGVTTTLDPTGQQWDYPNGWAPIQHMLVDGLNSQGSAFAKGVARDIATRWVSTTYKAWRATDHLFEKYNTTAIGSAGGGGEYHTQVGFGWTNGALLAMLDYYKDLPLLN
jgi:alpha,alpha-trehalase